MQLKTFPKGGVHPPEYKLTADKPLKILPVPKQLVIPIQQQLGRPGEILVKKKDKVKVGQLIVKATGFVSANIHSPVSGTVTKIDKVIDASGYKVDAIVIKVDDEQVWEENIDRSEDIKRDITLTSEQIIKKVEEMGIVGLGGATFPSHVKLSIPPGKKCELLIINGVECEPFLTSDHRLMLEKTEQILIGTKILMKALKVDKAVIGIEANKPDAIEKMLKFTENYPEISVQPLKVKYPQGGEKQLIKAITGREVPSGGLPIDVGVVVHNVGTTYAVYEAVQKNKPLFERVVTITGPSVKQPGNYIAKIGTPISALIEAAGGLPEDTAKIIAGGPMMGKALKNTDVPITKGTSGILILPRSMAYRREVQPCIRCARCVNACPQGLEPYLLMSVAQKQIWDIAEQHNVMDCIECGSCSYICPSSRPLLDYIRFGKRTVGAIIRERKQKSKK